MPYGSPAPRHGVSQSWWERTKPARLKLLRIAFGFVIGGLGAFTFLTLKLPLPWFLGSLSFCLIASVLAAPFERPIVMSVPVRAVLGVTVGAAFTPALLNVFGGMVSSLILLIPYTLVVIVVGMAFFERLARFDRPTAFFCAVPGGLTDMVTMAEDAGANARAVTLIQASRIVIIVALLPFWLQLTGHQGIGGATIPGIRLSQFNAVDGAVLIAIGWVGWLIARRVGLAGAPLIGPMILSGIAHASGLTSAKVPVEIMNFAQITLGILLGSRFGGVTWKEFSTTMVWGIGFAVIIIVMTVVAAIGISHLTGFDSTSVLLAYAPGGQTELNILAYILGLDVAYTAIHHLARVAIVIFGAQIVFAVTWRDNSSQ